MNTPNFSLANCSRSCGTCVACLQATLQKLIATQQATIQKLHEKFPTLRDYARREFSISNETGSSAHVNTNHRVAKHTPMTVPEIRIDDSFWDERICDHFDTSFMCVIDSEADMKSLLCQLIRDVIKGLGLENHLDVMLDAVPIMDTAPDLIIRTKVNKIIIGSVEGKKPPKGTNKDKELKKIFVSNGEAFEQLCLCKIQLGTDTVGLISTLKGYQLLSTKNLSNEDVLTLDKAKSFFNSYNKDIDECSPEKTTKNNYHGNECQRGPKKRTKSIALTKREEKGSNKKIKNGRVSTVINNTSDMVERKYFASKVFNLGSNKEDNVNVLSCSLPSYFFA